MRFMAAARGISVGWAIAGYGLLREAIELLMDVATQVDEKELNSFFDVLDGEDSLAKLTFPDRFCRYQLTAGLYSRDEIFDRIISCIPAYNTFLAETMSSENKRPNVGLGNA